jgi:hypothetical protein
MHTTPIEFDGLRAIEITTARLRMVVVAGLGPRIAYLGRLGGENLFYWKADDLGREGWRLLGGHRVWATRPLADESEDAYAADNDPCEASESDGALTILGAPHAFLKTQRGITIRAVDEDTFEVTSFITNDGPMLYSSGVWCPTCIQPRPGMTFSIPLGDRLMPWDIIKIVIPRTWADHTSRVNDPQISFNEETLIIDPQGVETKRMVWAPLGIIAMTWPGQGISFVKRTHSNMHGQYPLGCNVAAYIGPGNFMVEMESYGEERTLFPGDTVANVETWKVVDEVLDWKDPARLIALGM